MKTYLPGFAKKGNPDKKTITAFWDYEDFRRILRKWHMNLTNALKACFNSGEYMHIRNAINILNNVYQHFPAVTFMGNHIVECVTKLSQNELRGDLKLAAASLLGNLKRMEKNWVMPQAFNLVEGGANAPNIGRAGSSKPGTPRLESETTTSLNPKAPEFQPDVNGNMNSSKVPPGSAGPEDGEIDDSQIADQSRKNPVGKAEKGPMADIVSDTKSRPASPKPLGGKSSPPPAPTSTSTSQTVGLRSSLPTAASINPSIPPRPEINHSTSASSRGQQELPPRPEIPQTRVGDHRIPPRPNDRTSQEFQRDTRFPERPTTDKPRDFLRDRSERGPPFQGSEKTDGRSRADRTERLGGENLPPPRLAMDDRSGPTSHRDTRQSLRDERTGLSSSSRQLSDQGQTQQDREATMLPPRSTNLQHPERASINPERAALIHGRQEADRGQPAHLSSDRRGDGSRRGDLPRSEHSSRGASPTRGIDRGPPLDGRRFDRKPEENYRTGDEPPHLRPRYEEGYAPSGPRTERPGPGVSSNLSSDRFRESMKPTAPTGPAAFDPGHGRLNQDHGRGARQAESRYGRLNAGNDVPSGPRIPNGNHPPSSRGGRNVSAPQPPSAPQHSPSSSQINIGAPLAQDGQTPSGPSMRGPPSHSQTGPASSPPTPTGQAPEAAGVHPDRLRAIQGAETPAPASVHPDRLRAIEGNGPPGRPNGPGRGEPSQGPRQPPPLSVPPSQAPSRGQGPLPSPLQQSPTSRGGPPPPTGPSYGGDRGRDKRFAGLQGVLQQNGPSVPPERSNQGASIRGRGGRTMPPSPSASGPPKPNLPPARDVGLGREDLFAGRANGPASFNNVDNESSYGRGGRRGPPRDARDGDRRSGRHRSRSPGKDGASDAPPPRLRDDERPSREDPRDRFRTEMAPQANIRGGAEREMRGPPALPPPSAPERELRGGRPTRASAREEPMDRRGSRDGAYDGRGGDERRDGGGRDAGGSMRKRGRGGEEPAGERHVDSKRARR